MFHTICLPFKLAVESFWSSSWHVFTTEVIDFNHFNWNQMSKSQTFGLWRRFTKNKIDIMRFMHIDINFDITHEGHQNWWKYFSWTSEGFDDHMMSNLMSMCEPLIMSIYYFFVNLLHLTSFLTTWHIAAITSVPMYPITCMTHCPCTQLPTEMRVMGIYLPCPPFRST